MSITTGRTSWLAVLHAPLAAEDRQAAHGERQFAVGLLEAETHGALVDTSRPATSASAVLYAGEVYLPISVS
jgi:hypothetical protein